MRSTAFSPYIKSMSLPVCQPRHHIVPGSSDAIASVVLNFTEYEIVCVVGDPRWAFTVSVSGSGVVLSGVSITRPPFSTRAAGMTSCAADGDEAMDRVGAFNVNDCPSLFPGNGYQNSNCTSTFAEYSNPSRSSAPSTGIFVGVALKCMFFTTISLNIGTFLTDGYVTPDGATSELVKSRTCFSMLPSTAWFCSGPSAAQSPLPFSGLMYFGFSHSARLRL